MIALRKLFDSNEFRSIQPIREPCVVCFDREATRTCIPCLHEALCEECFSIYEKSFQNCPICRKDFISLSRRK